MPQQLTDILVFVVPSVIFCVVKFFGYSWYAGVLALEDLNKKQASFFRCLIGLGFDATFCLVIWYLFSIKVLPISRGHVGLPVDYLLLPLFLSVPRVLSWTISSIFVFRLKKKKISAVIYGVLYSYFLDFVTLGIWWFVWFTLLIPFIGRSDLG
jgi:hypothetical protein